jgi:hypothetical protein
MLVAAMQSTGTRNSSRTASTPMCAPPRAPPPPRASATFGRDAAWAAAVDREEQQKEAGGEAPAELQTFSEKGVNRVSRS